MCEQAAGACALGTLRRASRAISRFYEAAFAPLNLTATQFAILVGVHLHGPVPLMRLADALSLDRTSLYRALRPLTRRGCVRTGPGRVGRERVAMLTPAGRTLLAEALPRWAECQRRFAEAFGPEEWPDLPVLATRVVHTVAALEGGAPAAAEPTIRTRRRAARSTD